MEEEKNNRFLECIHCDKVFECKDKKYKTDLCIRFGTSGKN